MTLKNTYLPFSVGAVIVMILCVACMSGAQKQAIDDARVVKIQLEHQVMILENEKVKAISENKDVTDLNARLAARMQQLDRADDSLRVELAEGRKQKEESITKVGVISAGVLKFGAGLAGETFGIPKLAAGFGGLATLLQMFKKKNVG